MPSINLNLSAEDGVWDEVDGKKLIEFNGTIDMVTLKNGTDTGRPTVLMRMSMDDGIVIVCQTTVRLFINAAKMMEVHHAEDLKD